MNEPAGEFSALVIALIMRFAGQTARPVPDAWMLERFTAQLAALIARRGLPRALQDDEVGSPGSMPEQESTSLVANVMEGLDDPVLADVARQLVKACFYPEFKQCRDSFREIARDGTCRRQELERVRTRISGTHCVDCPHWVALAPDQHTDFLAREWRSDPALWDSHRHIFLPEDFRAIRRWLHAAARTGSFAS